MKIPKKVIIALTLGAIIASNSAPAIASAEELLNEEKETEITLENDEENSEQNEESIEVSKEDKSTESEDKKKEEVKETNEAVDKEKVSIPTLNQAIENTIGYYRTRQNQLTEWWHIAALNSVGEDINKAPYKLPKWDADTVNASSSIIKDAGYILGLIAQGQDPKNYQGKDCAKVLADKQRAYGNGKESFNGTNFNMWAIIALEISNQKYDKEFALETLLKYQRPDGSFTLSSSWDGSTDLTGMALISLSFYQKDENYKKDRRIKDSINKALLYLDKTKNENGTFARDLNSKDGDGNSTSMAVTGLLSIGEDLNSSRWNGTTTGILSLQVLEDGSLPSWNGTPIPYYKGQFYWVKTPKPQVNDMATYQALLALGDIKNGTSVWDRMAEDYDALEIDREQKKLPKIYADTIVANIGDKIDLLKDVRAEDKDGNKLDVSIVKENIPTTSKISTKPGLYSVTYKAVDSEGREQIKVVDVKINNLDKLTIIDDASKVDEVMKKIAQALKEVDDQGNFKYSLEQKEAEKLDEENLLYTFIITENLKSKSPGDKYEIRIILPKDVKAPEVPKIEEVDKSEEIGKLEDTGKDTSKNNNENKNNNNNPQTGDTSILAVGVIGLASIGGLAVINRRKK